MVILNININIKKNIDSISNHFCKIIFDFLLNFIYSIFNIVFNNIQYKEYNKSYLSNLKWLLSLFIQWINFDASSNNINSIIYYYYWFRIFYNY